MVNADLGSQASSNVNPQTMDQLRAAQKNVDDADTKVTTELKKAVDKFKIDPNGEPAKTPWSSWYPDNAPQYVHAMENYDDLLGVLTLLTDKA